MNCKSFEAYSKWTEIKRSHDARDGDGKPDSLALLMNMVLV